MNFLSQLTGCFSQPSAENSTVAMVEAAYRHHNLDWRYINCEVPPKRLADANAVAKAMGWAGFNCSLPHKVAAQETRRHFLWLNVHSKIKNKPL